MQRRTSAVGGPGPVETSTHEAAESPAPTRRKTLASSLIFFLYRLG